MPDLDAMERRAKELRNYSRKHYQSDFIEELSKHVLALIARVRASETEETNA